MAWDQVTAPWHLGLYPQAEAARYSSIPASTVHRWIDRDGALRAEGGLVSFDEFVSLLFVRQLRARGVPFREIVTAEADLRERTGHRHPFAHETLWTAGRDILIHPREAPTEFISANRRGQIAISGLVTARVVMVPRPPSTGPATIVLPEAVDAVRGEVRYLDGRIVAWQPAERISAAPSIQFGATCIEGTRLPTRVIYDVALGGDPTAVIARLYGITEADVESAITWERALAA